MRLGVWPFSTHRSSVPMASNVFGPSPPRQWFIPGAMNSRIESCSRPFVAGASRMLV